MDGMNTSNPVASAAASASAASSISPFASFSPATSSSTTTTSPTTPRQVGAGADADAAALALFVETTHETNAATSTSPAAASSFEAIMKEKSRQRKEREDAAVASLRVQVKRLEAALCAETKRRIAVTQQLSQERIQSEIMRLEHDMRNEIIAHTAHLDERYASLEHRLSSLEDAWKHNVLNMEKMIDKTSKELRETVDSLRQATVHEQATRVHKEELLLQQLTELERAHNERWNLESQQRNVTVNALQVQLHQHEQQRTQQVDSYQGQLQHELQMLQMELQQEKKERQVQDDDIVKALNRYCEKLQQTMTMVVSDV